MGKSLVSIILKGAEVQHEPKIKHKMLHLFVLRIRQTDRFYCWAFIRNCGRLNIPDATGITVTESTPAFNTCHSKPLANEVEETSLAG
jgi:hypothetical protein